MVAASDHRTQVVVLLRGCYLLLLIVKILITQWDNYLSAVIPTAPSVTTHSEESSSSRHISQLLPPHPSLLSSRSS